MLKARLEFLNPIAAIIVKPRKIPRLFCALKSLAEFFASVFVRRFADKLLKILDKVARVLKTAHQRNILDRERGLPKHMLGFSDPDNFQRLHDGHSAAFLEYAA